MSLKQDGERAQGARLRRRHHPMEAIAREQRSPATLAEFFRVRSVITLESVVDRVSWLRASRSLLALGQAKAPESKAARSPRASDVDPSGPPMRRSRAGEGARQRILIR